MIRLAFACVMCVGCGIAWAGESNDAPAALHAQYEALRAELDHSDFERPLHLASAETPDHLQGDVHAVLGHPFAGVRGALDGAQHWCDILLLHLNVKACRVADNGRELRVYIGKKFDEPASATHRLDLAYRVVADSPDYFRLSLTADNGPLGTRDYRITVEGVPLDSERTFLHLSYGYSYGLSAKVALEAYLGTIAGRKVGFTAEGVQPNGRPALVGGLRGALERNVMRYYLAVDAYVAALSAPPDARLEERLRDWFDSTERYALQLHELDEDAYLEMKRRECASAPNEP